MESKNEVTYGHQNSRLDILNLIKELRDEAAKKERMFTFYDMIDGQLYICEIPLSKLISMELNNEK